MANLETLNTDGLNFSEQGSDPSTPASGVGRLYVKSDGVYFIDDAGTVTGPLAEATSAANLESAKVTRNSIGSNLTTTSATWADMDGTNLTITMTTGARRVMLLLTCSVNSDAVRALGLNFSVDSTAVVAEAAASRGVMALETDATFRGISMMWITDVLTAASHTFRPRWNNRSNAGTITAFQSGANDTITFSAVELLAD